MVAVSFRIRRRRPMRSAAGRHPAGGDHFARRECRAVMKTSLPVPPISVLASALQ